MEPRRASAADVVDRHDARTLMADVDVGRESRRAPPILSCLQTLFEQCQEGAGLDDALQACAQMLADQANAGELEIGELS